MSNEYLPGLNGAPTWDDEIAANAAMFLEADRLDAVAYNILEENRDIAQAWVRFADAKKLADTHRRAAFEDWMRIKQQMKKS